MPQTGEGEGWLGWTVIQVMDDASVSFWCVSSLTWQVCVSPNTVLFDPLEGRGEFIRLLAMASASRRPGQTVAMYFCQTGRSIRYDRQPLLTTFSQRAQMCKIATVMSREKNSRLTCDKLHSHIVEGIWLSVSIYARRGKSCWRNRSSKRYINRRSGCWDYDRSFEPIEFAASQRSKWKNWPFRLVKINGKPCFDYCSILFDLLDLIFISVVDRLLFYLPWKFQPYTLNFDWEYDETIWVSSMWLCETLVLMYMCDIFIFPVLSRSFFSV